jgi:hypothetical protein
LRSASGPRIPGTALAGTSAVTLNHSPGCPGIVASAVSQ